MPSAVGARDGRLRGARGRPGTSTAATPVPTSPAVAAGARRRVALPAEALGALAQAVDEVARAQRRAASGSTSGSLRIRSSTGSSPSRRELVDRGLEREHARALAGRAHPRRRRHVEAASRWPVRRLGAAYMTRVGVAVCSANSRASRSARRRRGRSPQPPVARRRRGAGAGWSACGSRPGRTSAGGQRQLHRPARRPCGERGQDDCGRGVPLEPKPPPTWREITRTRSGGEVEDLRDLSRAARRRPGWSRG